MKYERKIPIDLDCGVTIYQIMVGGKWKPFEGYGDWSKPNTLSISPMKRWDFGCSVEVKLVVNEHYVLSAGYRRGLLEQQNYYKLNANSLRFSIGYIL